MTSIWHDMGEKAECYRPLLCLNKDGHFVEHRRMKGEPWSWFRIMHDFLQWAYIDEVVIAVVEREE